jgi:ATP-dependent protease ClpP protease subunit
MAPKIKRIFSAAVAESVLELLVYDVIGENFWDGGGVTVQSVADAIKSAGNFDRIALRVNSPGGSCFEGVAIYNLIRGQGKPVDVYVDGLAASAAATIAMCGDKVSVGVGAMIMVHNAASFMYGDANAMRKEADVLDKVSQTVGEIYAKKSGKTSEKIKSLMDAETWMSAQEAIDLGFADELLNQDEETSSQSSQLAKSFNLKHYKHAPDELRNGHKPRNAAAQCACDCANCAAGACSSCTNQDCTDPGCVDCPNQEPIGSHADPDVFDANARERLALYERS